MDTNLLVQAALKKGTFYSARTSGLLNGFKPQTGMTTIFMDGSTGVVLRNCNGLGDFTVLLDDGDKVRCNTGSGLISGYIG